MRLAGAWSGLLSLPVAVRTSERLVLWKPERRNGRLTKVPYQPARPTLRAAVDRPETWGTFPVALAALRAGLAAGLGIVLGGGLVGMDLDACVDPDTLRATGDAVALMDDLHSYTELSPSRTGLHVLARGTLPPGRRRDGHLELYDSGRFFTLTGEHIRGTPWRLEERTAQLAALHARVFPAVVAAPPRARPAGPLGLDDATLLARARAAKHGAQFSALYRGDTTGYPSRSEADLALCGHLVRWTGGDAARVDRLFRSSGLMRPKWDEPRGSQTYGARTIACALAPSRHGR